MIGRFIALMAALLLAGCGEPAPDAPAPAPAMWEVTRADGQKAWLFGTVHALPDGLAWRTPLLSSVLEETDLLVVEVSDLGNSNLAEQAFTALATTPGMPPLLSRVPAADRANLAAALERVDMDEAQFASTETWAAALIIANAERTGEVANGVDRALLSHGLRVSALESFGKQFAIFDRLAPADQQVLLVETAQDADPAEERAMVEAWAAGDTEALQREIDSGFLTDPELRQALLIARNDAWTVEVVRLLDGGYRPLVAVGAAHLLGPEGLPALLAARGYTVRRIQ